VTTIAGSRYNVTMAREQGTVIDGRHTRWLEAGPVDAPHTLVWLHAFPLSADMWRPQLGRPIQGWRVIAPDLAGFGRSDDHDGPPAIDDFARDVDRLLDRLAVASCVLGGESMGGYSVFAYLRLNASRVDGVVLADTKAGPDTPQARDGRQKILALIASKGVSGVADDMVPKLLGATTLRTNPGLVMHVRNLIESNRAAGLARATERLRDRPDARPQLAGITVPALVIVGEEDGVTPVAEARAMAEALPDATLSVLPRAGHLSNLEAPEVFNAVVTPWLASF
jgi:3-oxoadipate enol-lactonase